MWVLDAHTGAWTQAISFWTWHPAPHPRPRPRWRDEAMETAPQPRVARTHAPTAHHKLCSITTPAVGGPCSPYEPRHPAPPRAGQPAWIRAPPTRTPEAQMTDGRTVWSTTWHCWTSPALKNGKKWHATVGDNLLGRRWRLRVEAAKDHPGPQLAE